MESEENNPIGIPPMPTPEQFGYHNCVGFDDEPSGWMYEGGEDAYYQALEDWNSIKFSNQ